MTITHIAVVIPARNEGHLIERCLASVIAAAKALPTSASIVVVDDGSTDGTAHRAKAAFAGFPSIVLSIAGANVGAARRAGVDHVLSENHNVAPADLWLAFTDADTHVPPTWLTCHLEHANRGADGVAGIVELDTADPSLLARFQTTYLAGPPATTHRHVHGANLGIRASAYREIGGFERLKCGEDRDLWSRLIARSYGLVSDPQLVVTTSARLRSRTRGGFATDLSALLRPA